jgi:hypothetical protein
VLFATCLISGLIAAAPPAARAQKEQAPHPNPWANAGAALCTLVYSPVKITYAASGLVVGGMAWVWSFGSQRVSRPIFRSALRGDYVVTAQHLTGERKLRFSGPQY